jgi:hypothetical protein
MSQTQQIKAHLESGKKLTPLVALRLFDCLRLAARINELRRSGMAIATKIIHRNGKHFAEYSAGGEA